MGIYAEFFEGTQPWQSRQTARSPPSQLHERAILLLTCSVLLQLTHDQLAVNRTSFYHASSAVSIARAPAIVTPSPTIPTATSTPVLLL